MQGLTEEDIQDRVYGSKITFVLEQSMVLVQWGCKACMILVYYRLTYVEVLCDSLSPSGSRIVETPMLMIVIGQEQRWLCQSRS